ncbi:MAG: tetratricopeptide repeat protein [Bacteroidetes bacterium]|nr:tetratricopeptide repeat protein [Bacteroidota bacterium]
MNKHWPIPVFILLSFFCNPTLGTFAVFAGSSKIDSLLAVLKSAPEDSNKVKTLIALSWQVIHIGKYPEGSQYCYRAFNLSKKINFLPGVGQSLSNLGIIHDYKGEIPKALLFYTLALKINKKAGDSNGMAEAFNNLGVISVNTGDYRKAREYFLKAVQLREGILENFRRHPESFQNELKRTLKATAASLNNLGLISKLEGNYPKALEYFYKSLKLKEETGDKMGIAGTLSNLGSLYRQQGDMDKALEYMKESLKIDMELGIKLDIAMAYNNIGLINSYKGEDSVALRYYGMACGMMEELSDKTNRAKTLINMGVIYEKQENYPKSLDCYMNSLILSESSGNKMVMSGALHNIGVFYMKNRMNVPAKESLFTALDYCTRSLNIAKEINSPEVIKEVEKSVSAIYEKLAVDDPSGKKEHLANSLLHFRAYIAARDSLLNEANIKKITRMESELEYSKKEIAIKLEQEKEKAVSEAESRRQNVFIIFAVSCLFFAGIVALVVYRNFRKTKAANLLIARQKNEIERQKLDMTDSIEYAGIIQGAMLPAPEEFNRLFPEAFILFKPKDIVSGDFYWITQPPKPPEGGTYYSPTPSFEGHFGIASQNPPSGGRGAVLLAVCDCTGHGVPGAFMSMLCNALLNETVNDNGITKPDKIFDSVRSGIISALKQKDKTGGSEDGMDGSLLKLLINQDGCTTAEITTANNPVYVISKGLISEIKPDRFPVGIYAGDFSPFTLHTLSLQKGDMIYITTDGYEDQIGGPKMKKFKSDKLREIFVSISFRPAHEQKEILEKAFQEWKGNGEQTDDVTVIGIRI